MTEKERLKDVMDGRIPDKVPHFELVFQLEKEAVGKSWATYEEFINASQKDREKYFETFFDIWEMIIDKYKWAAVPVPVSLYGYFNGEVVPEAIRRLGSKAMLFDYNGNGTFWMPSGSNIMDFIVMLYEHPERAHETAREKRDKSIEYAKYQAAQGLDFIVINSDYGFNQGPFISPLMFSEFVTPYLADIVEAIHDQKIKAILHSDGDLRQILDQLVSTGLDGYQSIDPQGNMDIREVKEKYGDRLILMGNVKTSLLQDHDEKPIRESVRYCMKHAKPGGRYIFSTSNCIFSGLPLQNYHVMLDEYEKSAYYLR